MTRASRNVVRKISVPRADVRHSPRNSHSAPESLSSGPKVLSNLRYLIAFGHADVFSFADGVVCAFVVIRLPVGIRCNGARRKHRAIYVKSPGRPASDAGKAKLVIAGRAADTSARSTGSSSMITNASNPRSSWSAITLICADLAL